MNHQKSDAWLWVPKSPEIWNALASRPDLAALECFQHYILWGLQQNYVVQAADISMLRKSWRPGWVAKAGLFRKAGPNAQGFAGVQPVKCPILCVISCLRQQNLGCTHPCKILREGVWVSNKHGSTLCTSLSESLTRLYPAILKRLGPEYRLGI